MSLRKFATPFLDKSVLCVRMTEGRESASFPLSKVAEWMPDEYSAMMKSIVPFIPTHWPAYLAVFLVNVEKRYIKGRE